MGGGGGASVRTEERPTLQVRGGCEGGGLGASAEKGKGGGSRGQKEKGCGVCKSNDAKGGGWVGVKTGG